MNQTEYPIPKSKRFRVVDGVAQFRTSLYGSWRKVETVLNAAAETFCPCFDALDCCNEAIAYYCERLVGVKGDYHAEIINQNWWLGQRRRQLRRLARAEKGETP